MTIKLAPAIGPAHLRLGFFGKAGSGKTYTMAKLLSQFIAEYAPDKQLAMFDTEGGAGYIAHMVKAITGKDLLVVTAQTFSELLEFASLCRDNGYVAMLDSATHPWRSLCADYLEAKKSRVIGAGGNPHTVRLSLKDWGPIKDMWAKFADAFRYDPVHWAICGREGDNWTTVTDDEGNDELRKDGEKMKTETETGYEPSLLVQMRTHDDPRWTPNSKASVVLHEAIVRKDRFDVLTGQVGIDPDIEFFRPHIDLLLLGGQQAAPSGDATPVFEPGGGANYRTIKARRDGLLENIKDDLLLAWPGQTAADKKAKVEALRRTFGTSSWTDLTDNDKEYSLDALVDGREILAGIIAEMKKE